MTVDAGEGIPISRRPPVAIQRVALARPVGRNGAYTERVPRGTREVHMATLTAIFVILVLIGVAAGVYYLLDWAIRKIAPPEPFARIAYVVLVLGVVAFCLFIILP